MDHYLAEGEEKKIPLTRNNSLQHQHTHTKKTLFHIVSFSTVFSPSPAVLAVFVYWPPHVLHAKHTCWPETAAEEQTDLSMRLLIHLSLAETVAGFICQMSDAPSGGPH